MKKLKWFLFITLIFCFSFTVLASENEDKIIINQPLLITSIGQNCDSLIIKVVLDSLGVSSVFEPMIQSEGITEFSQIFFVTGLSYKGINAANTTLEQELSRANDLVDKAIENSSQVVLVYLGGFSQKDGFLNQLVKVVASQASAMIVYTGRNGEKGFLYEQAKDQDVPYFHIKNLNRMGEELQEILIQNAN